jgi:hypothetical protein
MRASKTANCRFQIADKRFKVSDLHLKDLSKGHLALRIDSRRACLAGEAEWPQEFSATQAAFVKAV